MTAIDTKQLTAALRAALPLHLQARADTLTQVIGAVASGTMTHDTATALLAQEEAALRALAGRQLQAGVVIDCAVDTTAATIRIGAALTLSVPLGPPPQQRISGTGAVGIIGSVSNSPIITGDTNTVIQSGRDTIQAGRDVIQAKGDVTVNKIFVLTREQLEEATNFVQTLPSFDNTPPNLPDLVDLFPPADTPLGRMEEFLQLCALLAAAQSHGRIGVVAGPPGSGRLALLRALAEYAAERGQTTLLVRFLPEHDTDRAGARDRYQADPLADPERLASEDAIAAAFPRATALAGWGWVRLMAQVAAALGVTPQPTRSHYGDDARALLPLLRTLARQGPLVLALAHLDVAPSPWIELLMAHARELTNQPLLLLLALEAAAPLDTIPRDDLRPAQSLAVNLADQLAATLLLLAPVPASAVEATLGACAPPIADTLVRLTDGHVATMESIWSAWHEEEAVVRDAADERWVVARPDLPLGTLLRDQSRVWMERLLAVGAVAAGMPGLDAATMAALLWCGAQEGQVFTAQAAARALGVDEAAALESCDWLIGDDTTPGLLTEVGLTPLPYRTTDTWPARYRFRYLYLRQIWREDTALGVARQPRAIRAALAVALERLYYPETDLIAEPLEALFTATGQPNRAQPYRARREQSASIDQLDYQIAVLAPFAQTQLERYRLFTLRIALVEALYEAGRYREALEPSQAALDDARALADTLREALACNRRGMILRAQGEYAAARPLYERALAINEQALGPQHPHVAQSLNNLAGLLHAQGEYAAARPLSERALAINEQALGPQHPDVATGLHNLAWLCYAEAQYAQAVALMRRALVIKVQALGPQHPDTQASRAALARMEQQGRDAGR